jgi:phosphomevalonate kinase
VIATAPGKLILTGEYAVLDGAPALVIAVNRRVVATRRKVPRGSSPFLIAVANEIAKRHGADHPAARAAMEIAVDSSAFYAGTQKLGLGSSAAVTVAATALALAADHQVVPVIDRAEVLAIASAAHARAQGEKGARGSGADIAASVHGGVIAFQRTTPDRVAWPIEGGRRRSVTAEIAADQGTVDRLGWPAAVRVIPFFTGVAADTACQACAMRSPEIASNALIAALALAASATDQLASATGVPLVPACVTTARLALGSLGGTAKTTGAGGGDVGIAVLPASEDVTVATRLLIESGCHPLHLAVDQTGVDLQADAQ